MYFLVASSHKQLISGCRAGESGTCSSEARGLLLRKAQCRLDDFDCDLVMAGEKSQRKVEYMRDHEA